MFPRVFIDVFPGTAHSATNLNLEDNLEYFFVQFSRFKKFSQKYKKKPIMPSFSDLFFFLFSRSLI